MQFYNSFPPVDAAIAKLKNFDYVKVGENTINFIVSACAVVYAITSYAWTAFQLWWDDNGENVKVSLIRFIFNTIDFVADVVFALRDLFLWSKMMLNLLTDSAYFQYVFS